MPTKMQIGRMDRRITIQKLIQGQGSTYGEPTKDWVDWATVWANKYQGGGREFEAARQINAEIDTQFQIHWMKGLKPTMRILHDNRTYHIYRIEEVQRRTRINIYTKAAD
jgi:SPP1 family predicted phage head-tail adaptor